MRACVTGAGGLDSWKPSVALEDGIAETYQWIEFEVARMVVGNGLS